MLTQNSSKLRPACLFFPMTNTVFILLAVNNCYFLVILHHTKTDSLKAETSEFFSCVPSRANKMHYTGERRHCACPGDSHSVKHCVGKGSVSVAQDHCSKRLPIRETRIKIG